MSNTLKDWQKNGWLIEHITSPQEINALLAVADRDIQDAEVDELSLDARLSIAYSAIVQCAKIGLAVFGYRVARDSAHYYSIQSLAITLNVSRDATRQLNEFRKKRNIIEYDRIGTTTKKEIIEVLNLAKEIRKKTEERIKEINPKLLENT